MVIQQNCVTRRGTKDTFKSESSRKKRVSKGEDPNVWEHPSDFKLNGRFKLSKTWKPKVRSLSSKRDAESGQVLYRGKGGICHPHPGYNL